jgi:hypothetical protein
MKVADILRIKGSVVTRVGYSEVVLNTEAGSGTGLAG